MRRTMSQNQDNIQKWNPGSWTPKRCAVWNKLNGDARVEFEAWVAGEGKSGVKHDHQIPPEHDGLL
jgi:hypothetical protein